MRLFARVLVVAMMLLAARSTLAQSAADKATARDLATEGIELYEAGKYAEALDKLTRAEELFDAPVHLIYIARCQVNLGQYVEAAENYRRLSRMEVVKTWPKVFKDAVADAKKELPEVEPKVARLRLEVKPSAIDGLEVKIDDQPVAAAALGVDRPTNPGKRKVQASAPGYKSFERTIALSAGERKALSIELQKDETASTAGAGVTPGAGKDEKAATGSSSGAAASVGLGFIVGLRAGGALPTGELREGFPTKDWFGPGGAFELRAGVRIAERYTALLFGTGFVYQPGSKMDKAGGAGSTATARTSGADAGVGFMYSTPPGKLGAFGELDPAFIHRFEASRDLVLKSFDPDGAGPEPAPDPAELTCTNKISAVGTGLRLLGGVQIPIAGMLQLSPFGGVVLGQARDFNSDDNECRVTPGREVFLDRSPWYPNAIGGNSTNDPATTLHAVIVLGIGGDLVFGNDTASE